jgi:ribonuclease Z
MIDLDGLAVGGYSLGGFASCLDVPTFKLAVDMGVCIDRVVSRNLILITHAHVDHLGALAQHAAQRGLRRMKPATYILPPGIEDDVVELLNSWRKLDGGALQANLVTLEPGESHAVRADLAVRPFRTRHRVVSQGYLFESSKKRLADQYQSLTGDEIRELRGQGVDVGVTTTSLSLAVTGDTRLDAVLAQPEVLGAERLVLECTFMDDAIDIEGARSRGHVHLYEVAEAAEAGLFTGKALLLNHVSPRHSKAEALNQMKRHLPPDLMARTQLMVGAVS